MVELYNPNLKILARDLRKNMTPAEEKLWQLIRRKQILGVQFFRQKPLGAYIADFYAPKVNLILEVDGSQHYSVDGVEYDSIRENYLKSMNINTLHFKNNEILNDSSNVINTIINYIKSSPAF